VAVVAGEDIEGAHSRIHDLLHRLQYLHEWFVPGCAAVLLAAGQSNDELFAYLDGMGGVVQVERFLGG
jgi:hypothetical protein